VLIAAALRERFDSQSAGLEKARESKPLPPMTKSRLEAFSDGVLAIVITVMVLELRPPPGVDLDALSSLLPGLGMYLLSFIYIAIYWNNHHHLLYATETIGGSVLWANQHLLFWLSLIPFVTAWVVRSDLATLPTACYGLVLLLSGVAYLMVTRTILRHQPAHSPLHRAIGRDNKGKLSLLLYLVGILLTLANRWLGMAVYVVVALIWLVPDPRIESRLRQRGEAGEHQP
jgi:uncharacterized membrane protein